jgi:hypothetical protein
LGRGEHRFPFSQWWADATFAARKFVTREHSRRHVETYEIHTLFKIKRECIAISRHYYLEIRTPNGR